MADIFDIFKSIEKEKTTVPSGVPEKLIVFLGNPGKEYVHTRHNAGFMCSDYFSEKHNAPIDRAKFKAFIGEMAVGGKKILLMKPQTFMNLSGEAVGEAVNFYKLDASKQLIVVYDDIYLDVGRLRIRKKGTDGGHNGIKSIIYHTGTDQFERIRIGVGTPPANYSMPDWVLGKIPEADRNKFFESLERADKALMLMAEGKIDEAMNRYNG